MKKIAYLLFVIGLVCSLTACSPEPVDRSNLPTSGPHTEIQPSELPTILDPSESVLGVDLATLVWDPYEAFLEYDFGYTLMADEVDKYGFIVTNIPEEAYKNYILACRNEGWTKVVMQTDEMYWATDEKGEYRLETYWVEAQDDPSQSYIMVSVSVEEETK